MPIARLLLGSLVLAMAVGQLSNVRGFVGVLATFRVTRNAAAWAFGGALLVGELVAGVGLVIPFPTAQARFAATVAVVVALGWSALAVQAFSRRLPVANCACFGVHLAQRLHWWVLLEDAEFVLLALWVRHTVG